MAISKLATIKVPAYTDNYTQGRKNQKFDSNGNVHSKGKVDNFVDAQDYLPDGEKDEVETPKF